MHVICRGCDDVIFDCCCYIENYVGLVNCIYFTTLHYNVVGVVLLYFLYFNLNGISYRNRNALICKGAR